MSSTHLSRVLVLSALVACGCPAACGDKAASPTAAKGYPSCATLAECKAPHVDEYGKPIGDMGYTACLKLGGTNRGTCFNGTPPTGPCPATGCNAGERCIHHLQSHCEGCVGDSACFAATGPCQPAIAADCDPIVPWPATPTDAMSLDATATDSSP
jgi:hypothetical protein